MGKLINLTEERKADLFGYLYALMEIREMGVAADIDQEIELTVKELAVVLGLGVRDD